MTEYTAIDIDGLYEWISELDGGYFDSVEEMKSHFDVLVSIAGLLFWRTSNTGHEYFKPSDKVTVTVIETSGRKIDMFSTWCTVELDWLEGQVAMSTTPRFRPMEFRDSVKEFIQS